MTGGSTAMLGIGISFSGASFWAEIDDFWVKIRAISWIERGKMMGES
jgi:hypothetical protein